MTKLRSHSGYLFCVEHVEPLAPYDFFSDEPAKPVFAEEKLKTYDVVALPEDCSFGDLKLFDEVLLASEGSKFRVEREDVVELGLPRDTEWAHLVKVDNIVAKVVE